MSGHAPDSLSAYLAWRDAKLAAGEGDVNPFMVWSAGVRFATLTDAEREAVQWAIEVGDSLAECSGAGTGGAPSPEAAALRALLARLGGDA